ncbi:S8 family serine peptidase [Nocardiopsis sp. NPDC058631]|uniref:S8 family serine peptidase n=1 Tax=Nocardiopsis sp. NPDC058631 TaxID=3346566 RepID=UPI00364EC9CB
MARIEINGFSFDPVAQAEQVGLASREAPDASQSNYVLVQAQEPLSEEQRSQLAALGAEIHEYVPDNTYMCGYQPSGLGEIRALPFVVWADVYFPGLKIPPSLRPEAAEPVFTESLASVFVPPSNTLREVDVVLHQDVSPGTEGVREHIAAVSHQDASDLRLGNHKVRITVEEGKLGDLAALDEVRNIEEVPQWKLFNNVASKILEADVSIDGTPYKGEGEVVAVADTGFDKGSTTDAHPAFHGRVAKLYALGRPQQNKSDDPQGHGTHVAGSVLGDCESATMGGSIRGTAPEARLVLQSLWGSDFLGRVGLVGIPADLNDLFLPPYRDDGARIHTNSWGDSTPGRPYNASAHEIDEFVWNHPDMVICFAAGNSGNDLNANGVVDAGSIGSQAAAKNCITVGASESDRPNFQPKYGDFWPADFPADPLKSDQQADSPAGLAAFSSRGPTKEGRIKPDVVAPGTCILSALSRAVTRVDGTFGSSRDPKLFFSSGTSMATPLVAGCVAVLRETLVKNGVTDPSAALIKALLINGAAELAGQYSPSESGTSPNNNSGFGRVNLADSIIIPGADASAGCEQGQPLEQGEEHTVTIRVPRPATNGGTSLRATLVWTDPPGAALQNDLDLIVRSSDGEERHGNMGTSEGFDRSNNIEQVVWTDLPPGEVMITVRAHRITRFPQPYAYTWRIS